MSMDDSYKFMQIFTKQLTDFNERLGASMADLQSCHERVHPLWQDEMRRKYDAVWGPFRETMAHYLKSEGPGYVERLNTKLYALGRYLNGR